MENFTGARMTERNQLYSGIRLHIDQDRNIYFLYNSTYYMDGIARENDQFSLNNPSSVKEYIRKSRKSFLEELSDSLIDMLDEE